MRTIFTKLLLLVFIILPSTISAYSFMKDGIAYDINSDNKSVTITYDNAHSSLTGALNIPKTVTNGGKTYTVVAIGEDAFYECAGLTSVNIPVSVTSVRFLAFEDCYGLTSVSWNVKSCADEDFDGYGYFYSPFEGCSNITSFVFGDEVERIPTALCRNLYKLKSLTIPSSVTYIGDNAFSSCQGLTGSLSIPSSVTHIGTSAFYGCSGLESIVVASDNPKYDSRNNCKALIETETNTLLAGCKNTVIPSSITAIGGGAFFNCTGLTGELTIPNSVTSIGWNAFMFCTGLTGSLVIPSSVTTVGNDAFESCTGLTSISIPNSVTSIGESAFIRCSGLESIVVASGNPKYDSRNNCNALIETETNTLLAGCKNTVIPNTVTSIALAAFYDCSDLTHLVIPASVVEFGSNSFFNCSGLESIVVAGDNPKYDSRNNCNAIIETNKNTLVVGCKKTIIPNTVTAIGRRAFYGSSNLTHIAIPNSVAEIGLGSFENCRGLTSVIIPNSVTTIGRYAFQYCSGMTNLTIGGSVTSIGDNAFSYCSGLTSVKSHIKQFDGVTVASAAFGSANDDVFKQATLYVPRGLTEVYRAKEPWRFFKNIEEFDEMTTGDVNGDNKVDVEDVNAIINIILELKDASEYGGDADVTGDGKVDVEDVNAVINIILSN